MSNCAAAGRQQDFSVLSTLLYGDKRKINTCDNLNVCTVNSVKNFTEYLFLSTYVNGVLTARSLILIFHYPLFGRFLVPLIFFHYCW